MLCSANDITEQKLQKGGVCLVNFSKKEVGVKLGESKALVKPNELNFILFSP